MSGDGAWPDEETGRFYGELDQSEECTCYELDGFWYVARYCPVHVAEIDTRGRL